MTCMFYLEVMLVIISESFLSLCMTLTMKLRNSAWLSWESLGFMSTSSNKYLNFILYFFSYSGEKKLGTLFVGFLLKGLLALPLPPFTGDWPRDP